MKAERHLINATEINPACALGWDRNATTCLMMQPCGNGVSASLKLLSMLWPLYASSNLMVLSRISVARVVRIFGSG